MHSRAEKSKHGGRLCARSNPQPPIEAPGGKRVHRSSRLSLVRSACQDRIGPPLSRADNQRGEQPLRNIHGTLRPWSCAVLATALLLATQPAAADNSGGSRICEGPYALCSSAVCQAMAGDQTHVKCACEGPLNGLNIGDLSCKERTERLTSTFSLLDITSTRAKPAKSLISCAGENKNVWAFCLDAPCSADKGRLSCTCQLKSFSLGLCYFRQRVPSGQQGSSCRLRADMVLGVAGRADEWLFAIGALLRRPGETRLLPADRIAEPAEELGPRASHR